jgi:predicted O-methyltransferase YrrM
MDESILKEVDKIEGWFDAGQMQFAFPYISQLAPGSLLVELGSYHGRSTLFFRLANPLIKILTIDVCKQYDVKETIPESIDKEVLEKGNIFQVAGDSLEVVKRFNWSIDFLFIDTRHTYEDTKKSIELWAPFVKNGGYILFHDYNEGFDGVRVAVNEWLQNNKEFSKVELINGMALARKVV